MSFTAKNYLDAKEIDTLNRIVVMFLDQAEFRAQRRKDIKMADWETSLDKFLKDTELPVLASAGSISHDSAVECPRSVHHGVASGDHIARRRMKSHRLSFERRGK